MTFSGTGKTRTVVATIVELVRNTDKSILVCAQSNTACDEITLRLWQISGSDYIFRMYAQSFDKNKVNKKIAHISNFKNGKITTPFRDYVYQWRVVVCTLSTSGYFIRLPTKNNVDSKRFEYLFIDEAACVQESMALIPIVGV